MKTSQNLGFTLKNLLHYIEPVEIVNHDDMTDGNSRQGKIGNKSYFKTHGLAKDQLLN